MNAIVTCDSIIFTFNGKPHMIETTLIPKAISAFIKVKNFVVR